MKTLSRSLIAVVTAATLVALPSFAQTSETSPRPTPSPTITLSPSGLASPSMALSPSAISSPGMAQTTAAGQPNQAEMMKQMTELSKLNENHKLLRDLAGTWSYN